MDPVETLEELLEGRAQFIKQRSLACPDCVATIFGRFQHAKHGVCGRVDLVRVIGVEFSSEIGVCSHIAARRQLSCLSISGDPHTCLAR